MVFQQLFPTSLEVAPLNSAAELAGQDWVLQNWVTRSFSCLYQSHNLYIFTWKIAALCWILCCHTNWPIHSRLQWVWKDRQSRDELSCQKVPTPQLPAPVGTGLLHGPSKFTCQWPCSRRDFSRWRLSSHNVVELSKLIICSCSVFRHLWWLLIWHWLSFFIVCRVLLSSGSPGLTWCNNFLTN